ncbi:MAG TPA: hypothetical protein VFQ76_21495 [Longimicrobiaceae bacterium]|nr:hypothetical protein [Longimicrobiaceae bacterium]
MATLKEDHFAGGVAVTAPDRAGESLEGMLRAVIADLEALRTAVTAQGVDITAIAAKLDDDAGVTDTDYEAGLTHAALPDAEFTEA